MNAAVFNLFGMAIIVVGIILHIVCIALPHYGKGDFNRLDKLLDDLKIQSPEIESAKTEIKDLRMVVSFGIWKLCIEGHNKGENFDGCVKMGSSNDEESKTVNAPDWLKAVQALSIIGLIVVTAAACMSALSVIKESRGDRLRLLPAIICATCLVGGVILVIGNIVFAAKFKALYGDRVPSAMPSAVIHRLEDMIKLDWGFGIDIMTCILFMIAGIVHVVGGRIAGSNGIV